MPNNIHSTECLTQPPTSKKAAFSWRCICNAQQRAQDVAYVEAMGLKDVNDVVEFAHTRHLGQFDVSALHQALAQSQTNRIVELLREPGAQSARKAQKKLAKYRDDI